MKRGTFFILFGLFWIHLFSQNNVQFKAEYIDFKLDSTQFAINGIYEFNNSAKDVEIPIVFPFAEDVKDIDSIRLISLNNMSALPYEKIKKEIRFRLHIPAKDSLSVNIYYSSRSKKKNVYILTTTRFWEKPLEIAYYSLAIDKGINLKTLSLKPDSSSVKYGEQVYFWKKEKFLPEKDFVVEIE